MTSIAASAPATDAIVRPATRWPGLLALVLGSVFILGTGFTHIGAAHNAAHDARHAAGFPCH